VTIITITTSCFAEILLPQQGTKTKRNGALTIDYSYCSEGYIMAKAKPTNKALKLRIAHKKMKFDYDLNSKGEYEVFPLQDGNGKYTFTLFEKIKGNSYRKLSTISITVNMPDPNRCFLYPNQYINYTAKTPAVIFAQELCKGMTDQEAMADKIFNYICFQDEEEIAPDGSISIYQSSKINYRRTSSSQLPEIDTAFATSTGVCKDFAGLMVAMLRSVGIPAKYIVGKNGKTAHAWVVAIINGKPVGFDPTAPAYILPGTEYDDMQRWY
jgi:transglutaminase/protease-like cytokinesis protein 3